MTASGIRDRRSRPRGRTDRGRFDWTALFRKRPLADIVLARCSATGFSGVTNADALSARTAINIQIGIKSLRRSRSTFAGSTAGIRSRCVPAPR